MRVATWARRRLGETAVDTRQRQILAPRNAAGCDGAGCRLDRFGRHRDPRGRAEIDGGTAIRDGAGHQAVSSRRCTQLQAPQRSHSVTGANGAALGV
jgi:hypothetical protein